MPGLGPHVKTSAPSGLSGTPIRSGGVWSLRSPVLVGLGAVAALVQGARRYGTMMSFAPAVISDLLMMAVPAARDRFGTMWTSSIFLPPRAEALMGSSSHDDSRAVLVTSWNTGMSAPLQGLFDLKAPGLLMSLRLMPPKVEAMALQATGDAGRVVGVDAQMGRHPRRRTP